MNLIELGAYQKFEFEHYSGGEQFTNSGKEPNVLRVRLTTPIDYPFQNHHVTAILTEQAQRDLIEIFEDNLAR